MRECLVFCLKKKYGLRLVDVCWKQSRKQPAIRLWVGVRLAGVGTELSILFLDNSRVRSK